MNVGRRISPKGLIYGLLRAHPREGWASYLARFHITERQLSTAGPSSSFLFHLPAAKLLTNNYQNRGAGSGLPVRAGLPQQPGNAGRASTRGGPAGALLHLRG